MIICQLSVNSFNTFLCSEGLTGWLYLSPDIFYLQVSVKMTFFFFKICFWAFCAFIRTGQLKSGQETGESEGE